MTTTKKAILITSLIAVMIIPISSMVFARSSKGIEDAHKKHINKPRNTFGAQYQKWIKEDNPKSKQMIKEYMNTLVGKLEKFGITYTEKYEKDPGYWGEISSRHLDEKYFENNLLPLAHVVSDPYFRIGYAYGCWWILACHEWNNDAMQIGEDSSDIDTSRHYS